MDLGIDHLEAIINKLSERGLFSARAISLMNFDILRLKARLKRCKDKNVIPTCARLHLGCGSRPVKGWLNVDIENSDYDVDLACGRLPWKSGAFDSIISQHLIEHLEFTAEFIPLLKELNRILRPGGEIWLSCPDMEKICLLYLSNNASDLVEDTKSRWPGFSLGDIPSSHMVNHLFHQNGEHKNLYDFNLLKWSLNMCGFSNVKRLEESDLLNRYPEFPLREDNFQSIYISADAL